MTIASTLPGAVLVLGDLVLPAHAIAPMFAQVATDGVLAHDWDVGSTEELMERNLAVEKGGPEAVSPDLGLDAVLTDHEDEVSAVITHFFPITGRLLARLPNTRLVATARAGLENIDTEEAARRGIAVVNNPGRNANAVAEFTLGLMLAHLRGIAAAHHEVAGGYWRSFEERSGLLELSDKRIGLVGFGQVGRRLAQLLSGFGCEILVHDPYLREIPAAPVTAVALDVLLREADVVSLHARVSPENYGLIGARQLTLMRPSAVLVNSARAELVDEPALVDALRDGRLAGAALDVFSSEPLPADHPLRSLPQVTFTPHLAGSTREAFTRAPQLLAARVRQLCLNGVTGCLPAPSAPVGDESFIEDDEDNDTDGDSERGPA